MLGSRLVTIWVALLSAFWVFAPCAYAWIIWGDSQHQFEVLIARATRQPPQPPSQSAGAVEEQSEDSSEIVRHNDFALNFLRQLWGGQAVDLENDKSPVVSSFASDSWSVGSPSSSTCSGPSGGVGLPVKPFELRDLPLTGWLRDRPHLVLPSGPPFELLRPA